MAENRMLLFSQSCTIAETIEQHASLLEAISAGQGPIEVDFSAITDADVTLVQLLLATRLSAARRGRAVHVSAWSGAASAVMARAGVHLETFAPGAATME